MHGLKNLAKCRRFFTEINALQRRWINSHGAELCKFHRNLIFKQKNPIGKTFLTTTAVKPVAQKNPVNVTFVTSDGKRYSVQGKEGDTLLDLVVNHQVPLDGYGACEGTLACSTCHVVLKTEDYAKLPDKPSDEEMDMLDLAYGLSDTSRLGCQIVLTKQLDGLEIIVPAGTYDARENS